MTLQHDLAPYEAIVEQMPEAVVFAGRDGTIRVWNAGAQALYGFDAGEVIGRSLDVIIPEHLRRAHWAAYDRALAAGRTRGGSAVRTTRALHKDGRRLYVELSFAVVTDSDGTAIGALAVGRDGTERHLASRAAASPSASGPAPTGGARGEGAAEISRDGGN